MTIRTVSLLQGFCASVMITGALLLSGSSVPRTSHESGSSQALHLADNAGGASPDIFHHWGGMTVAVADIDPAIFHHWNGMAVSVAETDPNIFHHWGAMTVAVADVDPAIFHHWA